MKKFLLVLIAVLLWSCNEEKPLDISDLNFSDFHKEQIFKNKIKKTYVITGSDGWGTKKLDTMIYYEYDDNGNTILNSYNTFFGHTRRYDYDSLNLVVQEVLMTDYSELSSYRYEFDSDRLILKRYYTNPTSFIDEEYYSKPSGIYKFDAAGLIYEKTQNVNSDSDRDLIMATQFKYDSLNLLREENVIFKRRMTDDSTSFNSENNIKYYFTNKKIDSTVTIFSWLDRYDNIRSYSSTTYYNDNGLTKMEITMDSLIQYYHHVKH